MVRRVGPNDPRPPRQDRRVIVPNGTRGHCDTCGGNFIATGKDKVYARSNGRGYRQGRLRCIGKVKKKKFLSKAVVEESCSGRIEFYWKLC